MNDSFIDSNILSRAQTLLLDIQHYDLDYYQDDDNVDFFKTKGNIISQFPKTMIILSSKDPLRDEGYLLTDFLLRHNVNVRMREFLFYCHGFLCFSGLFESYLNNQEEEGTKFILEVFKLR